MIRFKEGVALHYLSPQITLAMTVAEQIYARYADVDMWVTSVSDGVHCGMPGGRPCEKGTISKHPFGYAVDLRAHDIPHQHRPAVVDKLRMTLGPDFTVLHRSIGTDNEHIHVEWDPKSPSPTVKQVLDPALGVGTHL